MARHVAIFFHTVTNATEEMRGAGRKEVVSTDEKSKQMVDEVRNLDSTVPKVFTARKDFHGKCGETSDTRGDVRQREMWTRGKHGEG